MEIYKSKECWAQKHEECTEKIFCDCDCHKQHKEDFVTSIKKLKSVIGDKKCLVCLKEISTSADFDTQECKDKFIKDYVS